MFNFKWTCSVLVLFAVLVQSSNSQRAISQDVDTTDTPDTTVVIEPLENDAAEEVQTTPPAVDDDEKLDPRLKEALGEAQEKISDIAKEVDSNERANEAKSSILNPIYSFAENLSFPAFYWLAFMFMVTGTVSFALQLVLGKLVALTKFGFSFTEILSDALGLVISLVGLVLTTQAATENSTFTESAFAVLSATLLGLVLGCIFYVWGQRQELQAIDARKAGVNKKD